MTAETFDGDWDHIIAGTGSAGCVLANRLSADPRRRVLLLEAGGEAQHPYLRVPAGFLKTFRDPRFNWNFVTEPGPGVDGRAIHTPRGRVLGGSSAINGHLWVRGSARDFDDWAQAGCRGWSHADVLPHFRSLEDCRDDAHRGAGGPQHVSDIPALHPIVADFLEGGAECGLARNPDYNGAAQEGVFTYQRSIRRGSRFSAASAFLAPVRRRANLRIVTGATVLRIETAAGRATGITFTRDGCTLTAHAKGDIVLAAGAIGTPHLLQVSGLGPAALSRAPLRGQQPACIQHPPYHIRRTGAAGGANPTALCRRRHQAPSVHAEMAPRDRPRVSSAGAGGRASLRYDSRIGLACLAAKAGLSQAGHADPEIVCDTATAWLWSQSPANPSLPPASLISLFCRE